MDACPINAVHSEYDMPDSFGDLLAINAEYFQNNPVDESSPPRQKRVRLPEDRPNLRVAVVGSGPAACYAVASLSDVAGVEVSVFERLPTPYGLVRAGVAPDHQQTKSITDLFRKVLARPSVTCYFNVEVGKDVSVDDLMEHHHAVIWAAGAEDDRKLGIPGEDLPGSYSAREFVAWYNGHPEHTQNRFDLSGQTVVLIGNGNVAFDVARALTKQTDQFAKTDMASHAVDALSDSNVGQVVIAARRGPENAAYTTGELLGLSQLERVDLLAHADEVSTALEPGNRRDALLAAATERESTGDNRQIVLRYGMTPLSIDGDERVQSVTFARSDGEVETIKSSLVLRAIGYRGSQSGELPFDVVKGVMPHRAGRVLSVDAPVPGLYCSGWIKRGATGVIGTNKTDAAETVGSLLEDFAAGALSAPSGDAEALKVLMVERQPQMVDFESWVRIDGEEKTRGRQANRSRVKFVSIDEMLEASGLTAPTTNVGA